MKKNYLYRRQHRVTYGNNVAAMVAICTCMSIILIALILIAGSQANIARRTHLFERHDGSMMRIADPWRPLPGCLFLQSENGNVLWPIDGRQHYNAAMRGLCRHSTSPLADGAISPAFMPLLLMPDKQWRTPLQTQPNVPMNRLQQDDMAIPQGAHIELTLNATLQAMAQAMTGCMTGHAEACADAGLPGASWSQHIEGAAARSLGLIVLDINSGAIEALASSHSDCYQSEHAGLPQAPHCPSPPLARAKPLPGRLDHHALSGAKPGSLVKPIMVVAFMRDARLGPAFSQKNSASRKALVDDIKHSDSAHFLDRAYCRERGFTYCKRLQHITQSAANLGWNRESRHLFALTKNADNNQITPRFMQSIDQQGQWNAMALSYHPDQAKRCAQQNQWKQCQGEIANSASELIGQGNAIATPLSIAEMLKSIARAANGESTELPAHLLKAVHGQLHGRQATLVPELSAAPLQISQSEAVLILDGMALTHHGGTATTGCLAAYAKHPGSGTPKQACQRLKGVAGKTGTPGFSDEIYTWQQRAQVCRAIQAQLADSKISAEQKFQLLRQRARCVQSPVKWYAALLRDDPTSASGPWNKAMVILAERNYRKDGWIDSKDDVGSPNVAAELGFRFIKNWKGTP